ncbi:MAG: hypothetical protein RM338_10785, partial [Nostoc sp. DedQUE12a]|nr:hypothetical protein [Nostoc sp. DedQUE12a]
YTAVFICMRYKLIGFEAGGRGQEAGGRKRIFIFNSLVVYLIWLQTAVYDHFLSKNLAIY